MKLTRDDLLIQDIGDANFARWVQNWSGVISGRIAPAFMNKFGVWFLRRPEGAIDMLDVFTGEVERVATSHEEFVANVMIDLGRRSICSRSMCSRFTKPARFQVSESVMPSLPILRLEVRTRSLGIRLTLGW